MALPAAVERKAKDAARLISEGRGNPAPAPAPQPGTPAPAPDTAKQLADAQAEVARLTTTLASLQGKYNAEVPRYAEELRESKKQLKEAQERAKELEDERKRKIEAGELTSLTEDELAHAGEPLVKIMAKAAREVVAQEMDARLKPINERINQFQSMSDAQYDAILDDEIPDFMGQNKDPKFNAWLAMPDPASGRTRKSLLEMADSLRQGYRVAEIFRAFRENREIGVRAPTQARPNIDPGPGGGNPPPPEDPVKGRIITRAEVAQFYEDKKLGRYRGREKDARAFEEEIFKARKEGRLE